MTFLEKGYRSINPAVADWKTSSITIEGIEKHYVSTIHLGCLWTKRVIITVLASAAAVCVLFALNIIRTSWPSNLRIGIGGTSACAISFVAFGYALGLLINRATLHHRAGDGLCNWHLRYVNQYTASKKYDSLEDAETEERITASPGSSLLSLKYCW